VRDVLTAGMLPRMADVSAVLRWSGRVFAVAGGVNAFVPVGDGCGNALQPATPGTVLCSTQIADQWQTVWLLLGVGVVLMVAGQVAQWRRRRPDAG
jgi:hypothetical protein